MRKVGGSQSTACLEFPSLCVRWIWGEGGEVKGGGSAGLIGYASMPHYVARDVDLTYLEKPAADC